MALTAVLPPRENQFQRLDNRSRETNDATFRAAHLSPQLMAGLRAYASLPPSQTLQTRQVVPLPSTAVTAEPTAASFLSTVDKQATHIDIMELFLKVLVLVLTSREQEKFARRLERNSHIEAMKQVVETLNSSGNSLLYTGIAAGVLGFGAAFVQGFSFCKAGDWLKDKLSSLSTNIGEIEREQLFKIGSKMLQSMSQSSDNAGKIFDTFARSRQTKDQTIGDIARLDWDDFTRRMGSLDEHSRAIIQAVLQFMQLDHEISRTLYTQS